MSNQPKVINQRQQSRRINSEEKLINYIRTILGEPMIDVDVSNDQIAFIIDDTIRKFSDFAYGGEQRVAFTIEGKKDIQDYILDDRIQSIAGISFGNNLGSLTTQAGASGVTLGSFGTVGIGYVPHITLQGEVSQLSVGGDNSVSGGMEAAVNAFVVKTNIETMNWLFGKAVNYEFNGNTKILRVFEEIEGPFVVDAWAEYVPNPEYDEIYNHPWIKDYCVALTRRVWSTISGKYSQSIIGGAEINYDKMQQEADAELERLNEELITRYSEALGIFNG